MEMVVDNVRTLCYQTIRNSEIVNERLFLLDGASSFNPPVQFSPTEYRYFTTLIAITI